MCGSNHIYIQTKKEATCGSNQIYVQTKKEATWKQLHQDKNHHQIKNEKSSLSDKTVQDSNEIKQNLEFLL